MGFNVSEFRPNLLTQSHFIDSDMKVALKEQHNIEWLHFGWNSIAFKNVTNFVLYLFIGTGEAVRCPRLLNKVAWETDDSTTKIWPFLLHLVVLKWAAFASNLLQAKKRGNAIFTLAPMQMHWA